MTQYWPDFHSPQWSCQAVITVSRHDLDDHKTKWSRHRSFLYGCDRSPETRISKRRTEIPNLNTLEIILNNREININTVITVSRHDLDDHKN